MLYTLIFDSLHILCTNVYFWILSILMHLCSGTATYTETPKKCRLLSISSWSVCGSLWSSFPVPLNTMSNSLSAFRVTLTHVTMGTSSVTVKKKGNICSKLNNFLIEVWFILFYTLCSQLSIQFRSIVLNVSILLSKEQPFPFFWSIREKTHSFWPHLWKNKLDYVNPLFRPDHSQTQGVLHPSTTPYCFKCVTAHIYFIYLCLCRT